MSSNPNAGTGSGTGHDAEAESVRRTFASMPMEKKLSTLLRIELDLVGDIAEAVVAAANRVADEVGRAFRSKQSTSTSSTSAGTTPPGPAGSTSTRP